MKIVVVIPTYNEVENVERLIKALVSTSKDYPHHQLHLLVVDDNSPDGTGQIVKKLQKKHDNISLLQGEKRGLGKAYLRGMDYAIRKLNADILFEIDADFQHDPLMLPEFIKKIDQGFDFVIGSRYIKGGSIPKNWGFNRKLMSVVGNLIVRSLLLTFKIHDWTSGYRAIKSEIYFKHQEKLQNFNGYTFQVAFLHNAVKSGAKIAEIPIHFGERKFGKSKIGGEYVKNLLIYLISTQLKSFVGSRFFKFLVVGGTGLFLQTIIFEVLGILLKIVTPTAATIIGGQVAIVSNFLLNNLWTFRDKTIKNTFQLVKKFVLFWLTSNFAVVILQGGSVMLGEKLVGENDFLIHFFYVLGLVLTLIWNYTIYNRVVWKTHKS